MKNNFVYNVLKRGDKFLIKVLKDKRKLILSLVSLIIILIVLKNFREIFFTLILIIVGALSLIHSRYFKYSHYLGFELCMMATVLTSIAYGPIYGFFTGFFSLTIGLILSGNFKHSSFISIFTLPLIGLLVPIFNELPLLYLGILMTLIYDAVILPLYIIMGSRIYTSVIFFITHILFNVWIFSAVAPYILGII